ncbi:hypothetical protein BRC60_08590 [Halobacteriales archaeon QH_1_68_42]|nr:MAG: hypothetical protein BRC60_08590 [Halobacteriales archaeon QH_1_68_42]
MESARREMRTAVVAIVQALADLVPLVGVLAFGWAAFDLLVLYWLEALLITVIYGFVLSVVIPEDPDEYGLAGRVSLKLVVFFVIVGSSGGVLLIMWEFVIGFGDGGVERIVTAVRSLRPAVLALIGNYVLWVLSLYFPERRFGRDGVVTANTRLGREFGILFVITSIVIFLVKPFFESSVPALVLVALFKLFTGTVRSDRESTSGSRGEDAAKAVD